MSQKKEVKKVDYKKELKELFSASVKKPGVIEVPEMKFIKVDGQGDPNTSKDFQEAVEVLFGLSYTIKFMVKQAEVNPFDYRVLPLQGLWYADDCSVFLKNEKNKWQWTLMIMQPDRVTDSIYEEAKEKLIKKKNPPAIAKARFETFHEGLSAQIMHVGPFADEAPTIQKLHDFIEEEGYTFNGEHHEIYLSDYRRCAPEKLRTIIRHPIKPV